jgi:hypothetical protein
VLAEKRGRVESDDELAAPRILLSRFR